MRSFTYFRCILRLRALRALSWATVVVAAAFTPMRAQASSTPYTFTTFAGSSGRGSADGQGLAAEFSSPYGLVFGASGVLYVADSGNFTIRRITSGGTVTTLAGSPGQTGTTDGAGANARFVSPTYLAIDLSGVIYVADTGGHTIRKILPSGFVTTLAGSPGVSGMADGIGTEARFNQPRGLAIDSSGFLWVADTGNRRLCRVTADGRVTTEIRTNDSPSPPSGMSFPTGLAFDRAGALFFADNGSLRTINPTGVIGVVYTPVRSRPVRFSVETAIGVDASGNVYLTEDYGIRVVRPDGSTAIVAGITDGNGYFDGPAASARFKVPRGVVVDPMGNIVVADLGNNSLRQISPDGMVSTVAGYGPSTYTDAKGRNARFNHPWAIAVDRDGNSYVSDQGNWAVRKISPSGDVTTLAGTPHRVGSADSGDNPAYPRGTFGQDGPYGLAVDRNGNVFVADASNATIRKITPDGLMSTFAGKAGQTGSVDGRGSEARFGRPVFIAFDDQGYLYVSDYTNFTIRRIAPDGFVTTFAGRAGVSGHTDGPAGVATFKSPSGLVVDAQLNVIVCDSLASTLRRITPNGDVTTLAGAADVRGSADGPAVSARFWSPNGLAGDAAGNLYITDTENGTVRRLDPSGLVTTLGGQPNTPDPAVRGDDDGTAQAVRFGLLMGVAADAAGNLFLADSLNQKIRRASAGGPIPLSPPPFPAPPIQIRFGEIATLDGTASGTLTYQWYLNNTPLDGATNATLSARFPGSYSIAATNGAGTTHSGPYTVRLINYLANMSLRATVGAGDNIAVLGFTVSGPSGTIAGQPGFTKRLLLRVLGPALTSLGVADAAPQPFLALYDSSSRLVASNAGWANPIVQGPSPVSASPQAASALAMAGAQAFALSSGSADCALFVSLPPGLYTIVASSAGGSGTVVVELYGPDGSAPALVSNLSARAQAGSGSAAAFCGFTIRGAEPASLLVRGIGPALKDFGIAGALDFPRVEIFDQNSNRLVTGTRWGEPPIAWSLPTSATAAPASAQIMQHVGAFPLSPGSADIALRVTLPVGSYSTVLSGPDTTGVGLVELYFTP